MLYVGNSMHRGLISTFEILSGVIMNGRWSPGVVWGSVSCNLSQIEGG